MAETPLSPNAVYNALPTVQVAGSSYPLISEQILAMVVDEREGGMSALELRLSNVASDPGGGADLAFEGGDLLRLGAQIAVYGGDQLAPAELFRGTITALEAEFPEDGPPELAVLAEDALQRARLARRTKVYADLRIADIARRVAEQAGLRPVIGDLGDTSGPQVQLNESDLAFLRRLLAAVEADLQVVGEELHVAPRADALRGTIELELHSQLRAARVIADLADQVSAVTVAGWDAAQGQRVSATSRGDRLGPGEGAAGADVLREALAERRHHMGHLAASTRGEAEALAESAFAERARRFVRLSGLAEGNPQIRIGAGVRTAGLGPRFDNTYYVTAARHTYDLERGYLTAFEAECAFWRG